MERFRAQGSGDLPYQRLALLFALFVPARCNALGYEDLTGLESNPARLPM